MRTALVATVRNEAARIEAFLASIERQTRRPDVVVITDGGSTDATPGLLEAFAARTALPFRWTSVPGNRSRGRNEAIRIANADVLAVTDVSELDPAWFERIVAPLERGDADVVAGWYELLVDSPRERAVGLMTQWSLEQVRPETFLPSSRSVAFTRAAWERVGGYPEDLVTTEDTVFDLRLKGAGLRFVFEPKAVVRWRPATGVRSAYRMYHQFAISDGQAGIFVWSGTRYGVLYLAYLAAVALLLAAAVIAFVSPFASAVLVVLLLVAGGLYLAFRLGKLVGEHLALQVPRAALVVLAMDLSRMAGYIQGRRLRSRGRAPSA